MESDKRSKPSALMVLVVAVLVFLLLALVVQLSWNYVVPKVFSGVGKLDYLHALVLLILARLLISPIVATV